MVPEEQYLFDSHRGVAKAVALRFWPQPAKCAGMGLDDLIQVGLMGIWRAAQRFEPKHGVKFITYATHIVTYAILDAIREYRFWPTYKHKHFTVEAVIGCMFLGTDQDEGPTLESLGHTAPENTFENVARLDMRDAVRAAVAALPAQQRCVMRERLAGRTLAAIGQDLGVVESRVCQIERAARDALRDILAARLPSEVPAEAVA